MDALDNCFSWDINSLCVDLFTTVYETEEQPEPIRKRPENDLTDDECQRDSSLHVTDGVKEELELESIDGGDENDVSETLTFEKTQNEQKEITSVDEKERSGSAENTNISCTEVSFVPFVSNHKMVEILNLYFFKVICKKIVSHFCRHLGFKVQALIQLTL